MHRHALVVVAVLLAVAGAASAASKLPASFKRCARSDPQLSECMRVAVMDALPRLKAGLPKLGVQPLDPLLITEMRLSQGGNSPVQLDLTFTNMSTTKILDNVNVHFVKWDLDKMTIEAETTTPHVVADSKYTVKGKVLLLPIVGSGDSRVELLDVKTILRFSGKRIKKADGKDYFEVNNVENKLIPKKMTLHMDNLFNGDKQLGDTMNRVLSENWELVFQEISPSLNEAYAELFKRPARALFLHVPLDDIVPDKLP